jgi:thiosulfate dehydrogenase
MVSLAVFYAAMIGGRAHAAILMAATVVGACHRTPVRTTSNGVPLLAGTLIPAKTTMVTAWDVPENPLSDASLDDSRLSKDIRWGYKLFTNTPAEAKQFVPGTMTCANCHLNAGQRERSLPLVAIAAMFPEYNRRSGRLYSLNDRIVDCFWRSENATGTLDPEAIGPTVSDKLPSPTSKEVLAIAAYITWLAKGSTVGKNPPWRGQNTIASDALVPVAKLDRQKGEAIFLERCTTCHGADGQGVAVGDKKPGPLWGPNSWNDGAGAARVYTLAGIVRYAMPYLNPGSLTDQEAQEVAAFINAKPRPVFPYKQTDYLTEKLPGDAVYYAKR